MKQLGYIPSNPLYPEGERQLKYQTGKIQASTMLSENKKEILDFLVHVEAKGVSVLRIIAYAYRLRWLAEALGNIKFRDATSRDFENIMALMRRQNYKEMTIDSCIVMFKKFYRWLYDLSGQDPPPKCVRWMQRNNPPNLLKKEDLLTEEEIGKIISASDNIMHKCIISVLYECGLRAEELRGIKIKDVMLNGKTGRIYVKGKMTKRLGEKMVPVVVSYSILDTWLKAHPERNNPEAYLFHRRGMPIMHGYFDKIIKRMAANAGIKKHVFPHLFRHSRATWLCKNADALLAQKILGHSSPRMMKTYEHLADEDTENSYSELYGIELEKKKDLFKKCPICGNVLGFGSSVCGNCVINIDNDGAVKAKIEDKVVDITMEILTKDPIIKEKILEIRGQVRKQLKLPPQPVPNE